MNKELLRLFFRTAAYSFFALLLAALFFEHRAPGSFDAFVPLYVPWFGTLLFYITSLLV